MPLYYRKSVLATIVTWLGWAGRYLYTNQVDIIFCNGIPLSYQWTGALFVLIAFGSLFLDPMK